MISRIAKYTIEAEIGRGGFGRVYRAYDPDVQRQVAIKVLTTESDSDLLKRFQAEIGTTGNLRHKNIVTLYECGEQSGVPYLVMELLEGETLEKIIKERLPLALLEKVRVMTQVAEGLSHAHSKGVIHRDVKPGNIMVLPDGTAKIMDFGIARVAGRNTSLTQEGYLIGTIPYMAPELLQGGKADQQTDIFAYGDVYYELLTGRHPFAADRDIYATVARIKTVEPELLTIALQGCPETLESLVHRSLSKEREIRYQSFSELLLDSEAVLVDLRHERASALLQEVRPLMESGDLTTADVKLQQVVELDPANREARALRAHLRNEIRDRELNKRISALLEESEAQIAGRKFQEAVETLETAQRLSNQPMIATRLVDARAKLEAYVQANKLVAQARRDQQTGKLQNAEHLLTTALEVDTNHTEAKALLQRVQTELERLAREKAIQDAIKLAIESFSLKRYDQALAILEEVEKSQPASGRVAELRRQIQAEKERAEAEKKRRLDEFNRAVSDCRTALQTGDLGKAGDLLKQISKTPAPEALEHVAAQLQEQLDARIRAEAIARYTQQAQDLINRKSLRQALELTDAALSQYPDDSGLLELRNKADSLYTAQQRAEAIASALAEARALRTSNNLARALQTLALARQHLGDVPEFDELARQIESELEQRRYAAGLEKLLTGARARIDAGAIDEALADLANAPDYAAEPRVKELIAQARLAAANRAEAREINAVLDAAQKLEHEGSLAPALAGLEQALAKHPQSPALARAVKRLRDLIAVEERRHRIAEHTTRIAGAISNRDWNGAKTALEQARQECPGEPAFEPFAQQIHRALFEARLLEITNQIRASLAANEVNRALEQLACNRAAFSSDPRWAALEDDVAKRRNFEAALTQAEHRLGRAEFDRAEEELVALMRNPLSDERVPRLLETVRDQRFEKQMKEVEAALGGGEFDRALAFIQRIRPGVPLKSVARIDAAYQDALLRRDREIARKRQEREAELARIAESVRRHLASDNVRAAQAEIARYKPAFPTDDLWPRLQTEIDARNAFLTALQSAEEERKRGRYAVADQVLSQLKVGGADAQRVRSLREAIDAEKSRKEEQEALETARKQVQALKRKGDLDALIAFLDHAKQRFPNESEFEAEQGRAWDELARKQELERQQLEQERVERERAELARQQRAVALASMREDLAKLRQSEDWDAVANFLDDASRTFPEEPGLREEHRLAVAQAAKVKALEEEKRKQEELEQKRAEKARLQRTEALQKAWKKVEQARQKGKLKLVIELLAEMRQRFPEEAEIAQEQDRAVTELVRVETVQTAQQDPKLVDRSQPSEPEAEPATLVQKLRGVAAQNRMLLLFTALLAVVVTAATLIVPRRTTPDDSVKVTIRSDLDNAAVSLGDQNCVTPNCSLTLKPGAYTLTARLNGYNPIVRSVALSSIARTLDLRLDFQPLPQLVQVDTNLKSGRVFIDNVAKGELRDGQFSFSGIGPGRHRIRVTGDGADFEAVWVSAHGAAPDLIETIAGKEVSAAVITNMGSVGTIACNCSSQTITVDGVDSGRTAGVPGQVTALQHLSEGVHKVTLGDRRFVVDVRPNPVLNVFLSVDREIGTLIVTTGQDKATVYVNGRAYQRTTEHGIVRIPLAVGQYSVRVEKNGFQPSAAQDVNVVKGEEKQLAFGLTPAMGTMELAGTVPGADVVVDGRRVGQTDERGGFRTDLPAGDHDVELTKPGYNSARFRAALTAGKTFRPDAEKVKLAKTVKPPDPKQVEAQDWDRVRNSNNVELIDDFLRKHNDSAHAGEARDLAARLRTLAQAKALQQTEDNAWDKVDKTDKNALQAFLGRYAIGVHARDAQRMLDEINRKEAADRAAEARRREQESNAQKARMAAADSAAILRALQTYELAVNSKDLAGMQMVWRAMPKDIANKMQAEFKEAKAIKFHLSPNTPPVISNDTATVVCTRETSYVPRFGKELFSSDTAQVTLARSGSGWVITSINAVSH